MYINKNYKIVLEKNSIDSYMCIETYDRSSVMNKFLVLVLVIALQSAQLVWGASGLGDELSLIRDLTAGAVAPSRAAPLGMGADGSLPAGGAAAAPATPSFRSFLGGASSVDAVGPGGAASSGLESGRPVICTRGMGGSILSAVLGMGADGSLSDGGALSAKKAHGVTSARDEDATNIAFLKTMAPEARANDLRGIRQFFEAEKRRTGSVAPVSRSEPKTHEDVLGLPNIKAVGGQLGFSVVTAAISNAVKAALGYFDDNQYLEELGPLLESAQADGAINQQDENGYTPLLIVLKQFSMDRKSSLEVRMIILESILKDLFAHGGRDSVNTLKNDVPPLMTLVSMCQLQMLTEENTIAIAKIFLEGGAVKTINHLNGDIGGTALSQAVALKSLALVNLLLANGADPNVIEGENNPLVRAIACGVGPIANSILHKILSSKREFPINPSTPVRTGPGYKSTLLHVVSLGGEHFKDNIDLLYRLEDGLKALTVKDSQGKFPEDIMQDEALKAKMKALREGYQLFTVYLRRDISKNMEVLEALQNIARHILNCNAANVGEASRAKAQRILEDLPIAQARKMAQERILNIQGYADTLRGNVGEVNAPATVAKRKGKLETDILVACKILAAQYEEAKASMEAFPDLRPVLEAPLRALRKLGNKSVPVKELIARLFPDIGADNAIERAATQSATAAAVAAAEPAFDIETAALDVETLEAWMKASRSQQPILKGILDARIADAQKAGLPVTISDKALRRYIEKARHILEYAPRKLAPQVCAILNNAFTRAVSNKFIPNFLD